MSPPLPTFSRPTISEIPAVALVENRRDRRSVSAFSRIPSPLRCARPVSSTSGISLSKSMADSLSKANELLNQEVNKLRAQVENLRKRCEFQELELQKYAKKAQEAMLLAAEESAKSKAAKEVIASLTSQIKDRPGIYYAENLKPAYLPNCLELNGIHYPVANRERHSRSDSINSSSLASSTGLDSAVINVTQGPTQYVGDPLGTNETNPYQQSHGLLTSNGRDVQSEVRLPNGNGGGQASSSTVPETVGSKESEPFQDGDSMKSRNSALAGNGNQVEAEWVEQYELGVYITLVALRDGTRDLKRVRFRRKIFNVHQAETWWSENRKKVYERYNVRRSDKSLDSGQAAYSSEGAIFSFPSLDSGQAACSSEGIISPFPNFCNNEGMEVVH